MTLHSPWALLQFDCSRRVRPLPVCFRSHDTRYRANWRRVLFSISNAVSVLSFCGPAMHSGISAGAYSAFTRGYQNGIRTSTLSIACGQHSFTGTYSAGWPLLCISSMV